MLTAGGVIGEEQGALLGLEGEADTLALLGGKLVDDEAAVLQDGGDGGPPPSARREPAPTRRR